MILQSLMLNRSIIIINNDLLQISCTVYVLFSEKEANGAVGT